MENQRIKWCRIPIEKEVLSEVNQRSDLHGFLQAFSLHGTATSFAGSVSTIHELSHGTPFKTKFWNEFFIWIFSFISWTNFVFFRTSHAKHHQLTLHKGQDMEVILPMRFRLVDTLYSLTFNPFWIVRQFKTHLRYSVGKIEGEWESRIFPDSDAGNRQALINWACLLVAGHTALAILFIAIGQWILIPITLLPFYCSWLVILCGFPSTRREVRRGRLPLSLPHYNSQSGSALFLLEHKLPHRTSHVSRRTVLETAGTSPSFATRPADSKQRIALRMERNPANPAAPKSISRL